MVRGLTTSSRSMVVSVVEALGRGFVVKRVTKKLKSDGSIRTYYYVYEQYRDGKRVVTKYIAPLDNIIEFYVKHRVGEVVDRPGFEPGTSRLQAGRSSRLSYRPIMESISFLHVRGLISFSTR